MGGSGQDGRDGEERMERVGSGDGLGVDDEDLIVETSREGLTAPESSIQGQPVESGGEARQDRAKDWSQEYEYDSDNYIELDDGINDDTAVQMPLPKFTTESQHVVVTEGSKIVLPCQVNLLADFKITWSRAGKFLAVGNSTMDQRVTIRRISNGTELQISKASQIHDQGNYTCGLSAPNSTLIVHTVEVEVAPKTTPPPQTEPTTTPEATSTADADLDADSDADAEADATAEVSPRVNIDSPLVDLGAEMEKGDFPRINLKQEVGNGQKNGSAGLCRFGDVSSTLLIMLSFFLYSVAL